MEIKTKYGKLIKQQSKYVIIAPHGVQCDDTNTAKLTELISQYLNASGVINNKFAKDEKGITDFNNIKKSHPTKNEFYKDITGLVNEAERNYSKCIVVYIHGMKDRGERVGIDIGCGLKEYCGELLTAYGHPNANNNTGVRRANPEQIKRLRDTLVKIMEFGGGGVATIGKYFPAWSSANGVQYHAGNKNVASMQLEISPKLREEQRLDYTANTIAAALKKTYG